jgi:DNA helicase-2/ATP-dependent DNA helicase PcrA
VAESRLIESGSPGDFARGARVFHRKFGYGTVRSVDGDRLDIAFDKAGQKKVIASFVVPEAQAG